jgi:DNA modification methylase
MPAGKCEVLPCLQGSDSAQVVLPPEHRLNAVGGAEWLKFTKTWFVLNPPRRLSKVAHPATFPTALAQDFVSFFTKPGDWVIDPFLGTGSTLIAAKSLGRNGVGIELYAEYVRMARRWVEQIGGDTMAMVFRGDSREILQQIPSEGLPKMKFCLTSPPYWSQLSAPSETHDKGEERKAKGLAARYGRRRSDLGNIKNYDEFLAAQEDVFDSLFDVMEEKAYLVVVTNNVYRGGRLYPLAFDTFRTLSKRWVPKDERIWCQDNKKLRPFGMFHSYIGNRSHHYCLVFRKPS